MSEYWPLPPKFKIYEALGAVADGRIELVRDDAENIDLVHSEVSTPVFGYPSKPPNRPFPLGWGPGRGEFESRNIITARQYSSSRNKFYTIAYDRTAHAIMANDNATWFVGYLGYSALALLLFLDEIKFDRSILLNFKDIPFKDINQKHKNDFMKAKIEIDQMLIARGLDFQHFTHEADSIYIQLQALKLKPLGQKIPPPKGY